MNSKGLKVLLIEDHPLVNYGLAACLEETSYFSFCESTVSLPEARRFIEEAKILPSLVILDIMLGEENGLDFLPFLKNYCSDKKIKQPPVLVCSCLDDPFRLRAALELGAAGYVPKTSGKAELLSAIASVLRGETYISKEHTNILKETSGTYSKFTKRELEVLDLIKQEKNNRQIAERLGINIRTVENHISNIYFKTGVNTKQDLKKL